MYYIIKWNNFISHKLIGNLPAEYRELEYIESNGTQYIDTEFNASSYTEISYSIDYALSLAKNSTTMSLFGAYYPDNTSIAAGININNSGEVLFVNGSTQSKSSSFKSSLNRINVEYTIKSSPKN